MAGIYDYNAAAYNNQTAGPINPNYLYNMQASQNRVAGPVNPTYRAPASQPRPQAGPAPVNVDPWRQQNDAELSAINTQYDQNRESLLSSLGSLETQKNQSLSSLDTQLAGVKTTIGNQRTQAQQSTDSQIQQAGSTAHNTQKQNRNVLRSLGILNSSAAGELLSKPINQFDQIRGQLGVELQNRFTQLDDYLNQRVAEHQNAYQSVINQYNDMVGKIQSDLRFNDRQRTDAVKAANAALSQRIAEIQSSVQQYQQAVNQQKQQYEAAASNLSAYNPTYDQNQIASTGISGGQSANYGPQIYGEDPRKKQGRLSEYLG